MRTIWHYPLVPGVNEISAPAGARPLYPSMLQGDPVIYMLVDPSQVETSTVTVYVVADGEEVYLEGTTPLGVFSSHPGLFSHVFVWG